MYAWACDDESVTTCGWSVSVRHSYWAVSWLWVRDMVQLNRWCYLRWLLARCHRCGQCIINYVDQWHVRGVTIERLARRGSVTSWDQVGVCGTWSQLATEPRRVEHSIVIPLTCLWCTLLIMHRPHRSVASHKQPAQVTSGIQLRHIMHPQSRHSPIWCTITDVIDQACQTHSLNHHAHAVTDSSWHAHAYGTFMNHHQQYMHARMRHNEIQIWQTHSNHDGLW